ncbi:MAG TPA: aldo/keto reductase [Candidatus Saccharimonadales bacterium]
MKIPDLRLNDKHTIPQIGLGLWQVKDAEQFATGFHAAIQAGYRHFDSAQIYQNEAMLGEQWQASGLKRADLFLTTKVWIENFGHNRAVRSFEESLEKLQTDYVDLLLLHFPVTILRKKAWQALEEIQAAGGARSIGVSNYTIRHLEEMQNYAKVTPAVNQVELHIFLQQPELVKYCRDHDILIEAYSPLAHARAMGNQAIVGIAAKHDKTYAQVMLRWCIESGFVVLPKSVTPSRIKENIDIFDFELDEQDMKTIAAQDQNMRTAWSPVHVP